MVLRPAIGKADSLFEPRQGAFEGGGQAAAGGRADQRMLRELLAELRPAGF